MLLCTRNGKKNVMAFPSPGVLKDTGQILTTIMGRAFRKPMRGHMITYPLTPLTVQKALISKEPSLSDNPITQTGDWAMKGAHSVVYPQAFSMTSSTACAPCAASTTNIRQVRPFCTVYYRTVSLISVQTRLLVHRTLSARRWF